MERMLASHLMSDLIRSISEIKLYDILKCFDKLSSLLRLSRKDSSPPEKIVIPGKTKSVVF